MNGPGLRGCDLGEAVTALLSHYGKRATRQAVAEAIGEKGGLYAAAALLRRYGLPARVVRVERRQTPNLKLPTLVALEDGRAVVLLGLSARTATVHQGADIVRIDLRAFEERCAGLALDMAPGLPADRTILRRIARSIAHHRGLVATVFAIATIVGALGVGSAALTRVLVDRALPDGSSDILAAIVGGSVLLTIFDAWFGWLRAEAMRLLDAKVTSAIAAGMLEHWLRLPLAAQQKKTTGDVLQAVGAAHVLGERMVTLVPAAFDSCLAVGFLFALWVATPYAVPFAVAAAAMSVAFAYAASRRAGKLEALVIAAEAREQEALLELVTGISALKAAGAEKAHSTKWLEHLLDALGADAKRRLTTVLSDLASIATHEAVAIGLLAFGAKGVLHGTLSLGEMLQGMELTWAFLGALGPAVRLCLEKDSLAAHVHAVEHILNEPSEPAPRATLLPTPIASLPQEAIVLDDVWFRHDPTTSWLLKSMSFRISAGEFKWIRAPSGVGKTTLLRVIAGLYRPERGEAMIFGQAASRARHLVSYLPQDAYLFEGSLLDNLRLLSNGATNERIFAAASRTGLNEWVAQWPMGFETRIPAGGETLSGGQRQLVLLTACVAAERPIVLLDEPMAHLDVLTRARLDLPELLRGRTVIAVAHDTQRPPSESRSVPSRGHVPRLAAKALLACGLVFLLHGSPRTAYAQATRGSITFEAAVRQAVAQAPETTAARLRRAAADAGVDQAFAGYLPVVSANGDGYVGYLAQPLLPGPPPVNVDGTEAGASVGVSLRVLLFDFGRTAAQLRAAKEQREETQEELAAIRDRVATHVAELYLLALADAEVTQLNDAAVGERDQEIAIVSSLVDHGVRPTQDLARAKLALTQAKLAWSAASERQRSDRAALLLILGLDPKGAVELGGLDEGALRVPENPDSLVEQAVRTSPLLRAARAGAARFGAESDALAAAEHPIVTFGGNASVAHSDVLSGIGVSGMTEIAEARVTVSWTPFDFAVRAGSRASGKTKEAALAGLSERTRDVRMQAMQLASDLRIARSTLALSTQLLDEARINIDRARFAYQRGTGSYLEFLDAHSVELTSKMALARARFDLEVASARLLIVAHALALPN